MTTLYIVGIVGTIVLLLVAAGAGFAVGFRRGRDTGWCEHYFDTIAKERARRDRHGRFVALKTDKGARTL